ncbi:MAG: arylsulfatase A [Rhodothermales bacterium]|jgi:arylsulfatase A
MTLSAGDFVRCLVILCLVPGLQACNPQADDLPPPNIVFIMADDMGWGDVESYNPESLTPTPNINRLAEEGLSFMDAHSGSGVCTPTRYGVMTGRSYWRTYKGHSLVMPYDPPVIPPERLTWGRLMQEQGYTTGYVGKWHLGLWYPSKPSNVWPRQYTMTEGEVDFSRPIVGGPTDLGFDYFFGNAGGPNNDSPYTFIRNDRWVDAPTVMTPPEMIQQLGVVEGLMAPDWDQEVVDSRLTQEAVAFITRHVKDNPGKPFFLQYSLSAPHIPWTAPAFVRGTSGEGPRGDMNALVDWMVGEVRGALESQGILDETILIFTSDNGPRQGANGQRSAGPYRGFKNTAYEGGHRVPFIARWPGKIAAGERSDVPISLTDMVATFAEFSNYDLPDNAGEDSYSVLATLMGQENGARPRPALITDTSRGDFSVRRGTWKLVALNPHPRNRLERVTYELFDLAQDPYETTNLADVNPDIVEQLKELLNESKETGLRFLDQP